MDVDSLAAVAERRLVRSRAKKEGIQAASGVVEAYMRMINICTEQQETKRLERICLSILECAETIKASEGESFYPILKEYTPKLMLVRDSSAVHKDGLSTREKIILLQSSKLNGFTFPPWKSAPSASEFQLKPGEMLFEDTSKLPISPLQKTIFKDWKRPTDGTWTAPCSTSQAHTAPAMASKKRLDLVQDTTTDCSVVASFCSAIARTERGYDQLLIPTLYPHNSEESIPALSENGKYIIKLFFNGCFRKVVIDDYLPSTTSRRSIQVFDRNCPNLLWPALLEKAYLKVRGGYDFPGSNSGTDLWAFTGWIPEQIFLHDPESIYVFSKISKAFECGDVLLTLGTGSISVQEQRAIGLIDHHDYAVLDLRPASEDEDSLLCIKNPWANATSSTMDQITEKVADMGLSFNEGGINENVQSGTFWMTVHRMTQYFEYLYLNWNPGLFPFRNESHFTWNLEDFTAVRGSFNCNPQFSVKSERGSMVWLLLSRHFRSGKEQSLDDPHSHLVTNATGHIGLYSFQGNKGNGQRVYLSESYLHGGTFVDSPNCLLRMELAAQQKYTIVVAEQNLPRIPSNFTLTVFGLSPFLLELAAPKYPNTVSSHGAWTAGTAGGNSDLATYSKNPQYSLQLETSSSLALYLETSNPDVAIHVKLLWAAGHRVAKVTLGMIVGDSGEYRRGCVVKEFSNVAKGTYTVVCSTFEDRQIADFNLHVFSNAPCALRPIPVETAGKWAVEAPLAVFPPKVNRLVTQLQVHRLTSCKLLVHHYDCRDSQSIDVGSPVKASIEYGRGFDKTVLAVTDDDGFGDARMGLRSEEVDLTPEMSFGGRLWIGIERLQIHNNSRREMFEVEVLTDSQLEIGQWKAQSY